MLRLDYLGLMRPSRLMASDKSYFPLDTFHSRTFSGFPEEQRRNTVTRLLAILYLNLIFLQAHTGNVMILHPNCKEHSTQAWRSSPLFPMTNLSCVHHKVVMKVK